MINMTKNLTTIALLTASLLLSLNRTGHAATINFDDGADGLPIGSYYDPQGVEFLNAKWVSVTDLGISSSPTIALASETSGAFVSPLNPIIGLFNIPVNTVSITGIDIGWAGARLDVYDALVGGNLLNSDIFVDSGAGVGVFHRLSVTAQNIRRFEVYQPIDLPYDGIVWDDLEFTPVTAQSTAVPEPSSMLGLLIAGGIGAGLRRKRKQ